MLYLAHMQDDGEPRRPKLNVSNNRVRGVGAGAVGIRIFGLRHDTDLTINGNSASDVQGEAFGIYFAEPMPRELRDAIAKLDAAEQQEIRRLLLEAQAVPKAKRPFTRQYVALTSFISDHVSILGAIAPVIANWLNRF